LTQWLFGVDIKLVNVSSCIGVLYAYTSLSMDITSGKHDLLCVLSSVWGCSRQSLYNSCIAHVAATNL